MNERLVRNSVISIKIFLYLIVSIISTIHVIDFFVLTNPMWLAVSLAIAFEIGAAASLAAILVLPKAKQTMVWIIFIILTLTQAMGNMYFAYEHANEYYSWIEMLGLENYTEIEQKRILAIASGAILPIIALGFIKSLVDYLKPDEGGTLLGQMIESDKPDKPDNFDDDKIDTTEKTEDKEPEKQEPEKTEDKEPEKDEPEKTDDKEPEKQEPEKKEPPKTKSRLNGTLLGSRIKDSYINNLQTESNNDKDDDENVENEEIDNKEVDNKINPTKQKPGKVKIDTFGRPKLNKLDDLDPLQNDNKESDNIKKKIK